MIHKRAALVCQPPEANHRAAPPPCWGTDTPHARADCSARSDDGMRTGWRWPHRTSDGGGDSGFRCKQVRAKCERGGSGGWGPHVTFRNGGWHLWHLCRNERCPLIDERAWTGPDPEHVHRGGDDGSRERDHGMHQPEAVERETRLVA